MEHSYLYSECKTHFHISNKESVEHSQETASRKLFHSIATLWASSSFGSITVKLSNASFIDCSIHISFENRLFLTMSAPSSLAKCHIHAHVDELHFQNDNTFLAKILYFVEINQDSYYLINFTNINFPLLTAWHIKADVSRIVLICRNQPLLSNPPINCDIDRFLSTTYMYSLPGFVYSIHVRSCSSSIHLALNPDKGCAQRQIDAYKKKYVSTGNRSLLRNFELPTKMDVLTDDGTKRNFGLQASFGTFILLYSVSRLKLSQPALFDILSEFDFKHLRFLLEMYINISLSIIFILMYIYKLMHNSNTNQVDRERAVTYIYCENLFLLNVLHRISIGQPVVVIGNFSTLPICINSTQDSLLFSVSKNIKWVAVKYNVPADVFLELYRSNIHNSIKRMSIPKAKNDYAI
ncbi:hypothetical protein AGLY_006495, partial [Aphis glycines]